MSTIPPPGEPPPPPSYPSPSGQPVYPGAWPGYPPAVPAYPTASWGQPGPAPGLIYASFWTRFLGYLIDRLLLVLVQLVITVPVLWAPVIQFYQAHPAVSGQLPPLPSDFTGRFLTVALVSAAVDALYFGGLVAWQGRTLGQMATGTSVVRAEDGGKLPPSRAFLRAIVFWGPGLASAYQVLGGFAGLVAFISLLSVAWDPRKQGWHDKLGRALVVKRVGPVPGYVP
ncbi:MAG TPA: RDD family protein [Candidatus Dormibacteraeota bacterium]|nr:RDD family protein [Candidatus Dormibacteraeota bacterium]